MATFIAFLLSLNILISGGTSDGGTVKTNSDDQSIENTQDPSSSNDGNVVVTDIEGQ